MENDTKVKNIDTDIDTVDKMRKDLIDATQRLKEEADVLLNELDQGRMSVYAFRFLGNRVQTLTEQLVEFAGESEVYRIKK